jgi:hypothetical protein
MSCCSAASFAAWEGRESMNAAQRVREPAGASEKDKVEWPESMAKVYTAGVGRIAEVQKKNIDIAVQQNAELIDLWKKTIQKIPGAPGLFLLELQGSGFERFAEIQKAAVDLVVEQSKAFTELVKDRAVTATKVNEELNTFAKKSVERVIAMQKKALDHSAVQARSVMETSSKQFAETGPMGAVAETMRRGVDAIVDAQKELLNIVVH